MSEQTKQLPYRVSSEPIVIEDRCWIGGGAIVLAGVTIGEGNLIITRTTF